MSSFLVERGGGRPGCAAAKRRSAILLVGDQTDVLGKYARSFECSGYAVDLAADEATAMCLASEKEFDVIVSDLDMHCGADGESLRHLREKSKRVPVVMLASGLAFASARAAIRCGADKYLLKPVSDERLLQVLVEVIRDDQSYRH